MRKRGGKLLLVKATEWRNEKRVVEKGRTISWRDMTEWRLDRQKGAASKIPDYGLPEIKAHLRQ